MFRQAVFYYLNEHVTNLSIRLTKAFYDNLPDSVSFISTNDFNSSLFDLKKKKTHLKLCWKKTQKENVKILSAILDLKDHGMMPNPLRLTLKTKEIPIPPQSFWQPGQYF